MYSLNQMLSGLVRSPAAFMISSWKPLGNCGAGSCANAAPLTVIVGAWPAFAYVAIGSDVVLITNSAVAGIVDISVSLWWLPALSGRSSPDSRSPVKDRRAQVSALHATGGGGA